MRTLSTAYANATGAAVAEHMRVLVKDSGGTWRDLTTYPGVNMAVSARWGEDVDSPHATATVDLFRELDKLSLPPLNDTSPLNLAFTPGGTVSPLLDVNRELRIDVAVVAMDHAPGAGDWVTFFHGRIDVIEPAGDVISLSCRDLGGELADRWIEDERVYSIGQTSDVSYRLWEPDQAYVVGDIVAPTELKSDGYYYVCVTSGTSDSDEPAWEDYSGPDIVDGTAEWQFGDVVDNSGHPVEEVMQAILDTNPPASGTAPTLIVEGTPAWDIRGFVQQREPVIEALRKLAQQIGWDVRYKWHAGSSAFRLTFFEPQRAKTSIDRTFSASDYEELTALTLDVAGIRNVVRLVYPDIADVDPTDSPRRKRYQDEDPTSIARYGRRFMEIVESSASQIDLEAEAARMVTACLDDLKDMRVTQAATMTSGFPWGELGDLYRFTANGRHYTSDQDLAVFSLEHRADGGGMSTSFTCRGKPSGGYARWHRLVSSELLGQEPAPYGISVTLGASVFSLYVAPTVGGIEVGVEYSSIDKNAPQNIEYEWYASSSGPDFVPAYNTIWGITTGRNFVFEGLDPGTEYWVKAVPRYAVEGRVIRGQPSAAISTRAGQATSQMLSPTTSAGLFPYNSGFEDFTRRPWESPPDHWEALGGWDTHITEGTDDNGGRSLIIEDTSLAEGFKCDPFPVQGNRYSIRTVYKTTGANAGLKQFHLVVKFWKDSAATVASTILTSATYAITNASAGTWLTYSSSGGAIPSDANFVTIEAKKNGAASDWQIEVGEIEFVRIDLPQPAEVGLTLAGSWANVASSHNLAYFTDSEGFLCLEGRVYRTTGAGYADGETLATLPTGSRPSTQSGFAAYGWNGTTAVMVLIWIHTDGTITHHAPGLGNAYQDTWISGRIRLF